MKKEKRTLIVHSVLETREKEGKTYISGTIPYNSLSEKMGGFREIVRRGAFSKSLQEQDIKCLWNHDTRFVCGRNKAGTLTLEDRGDGLFFESELPSTSWAQDLAQTVSRRDADGVSFGFQVIKDRWTEDVEKKEYLRELLEVRLFEVSVGVAFPAYQDSDCSVSMREINENSTDIDFSVVEKVMSLRETKKDYTVEESDAKEIRSIIDRLTMLLPKTAESREDAPQTEQPSEQDTVETRSRELALLEFESAV